MRLLVLLLLFPQVVMAATLTGTVYDLGLEEVQNAIITINTEPEQRIVAKDGTYSVSIPEGVYVLRGSAVVDGSTAQDDIVGRIVARSLRACSSRDAGQNQQCSPGPAEHLALRSHALPSLRHIRS